MVWWWGKAVMFGWYGASSRWRRWLFKWCWHVRWRFLQHGPLSDGEDGEFWRDVVTWFWCAVMACSDDTLRMSWGTVSCDGPAALVWWLPDGFLMVKHWSVMVWFSCVNGDDGGFCVTSGGCRWSKGRMCDEMHPVVQYCGWHYDGWPGEERRRWLVWGWWWMPAGCPISERGLTVRTTDAFPFASMMMTTDRMIYTPNLTKIPLWFYQLSSTLHLSRLSRSIRYDTKSFLTIIIPVPKPLSKITAQLEAE